MSLAAMNPSEAVAARAPGPAPAVEDVRVAAYAGLAYADFTQQVLADLCERQGVDFATTFFYGRILHSCEHAGFIREINAIDPEAKPRPRLDAKVLVAPAALYKEYPQFGGDGRMVQKVATDFGMEARVAPVPSRGSVRQAADVIAAELEREADGTIVLASLSKGGADVRVALQKYPHLARKLRAWIQVAGLMHGSPVISGVLNGSWWRRGAIKAFLACKRIDAVLLKELSWGESSMLAGRATAPPGVKVLNVVGFPLAAHLSGNARKRHRRMAHLGPNDGSTLLRDAIVDGGLVCPVWGADHYMRVPEVPPLLYRLFTYLARRG